ncbi:hypothetical protein [Cellulomonas triticagri]|uniref:DUF2690 domain-containing protein n=1 Tax=Cellulomonas triticagri TaxID=2483352 RepID=A0A3M2JI34_9CELL|nr:hypothetical protein [Cellulomonas triticagri]RMI12734.1 hypothetical protein EBM89_07270 [Cellulomonas triticagri]
MRNTLKRLLALVPVTALVVGGAVLLDADSAEAFGYNRAVSRACGQNWVNSSGSAMSGSAKTSHYSGSCQDILWAGLNVKGIGISWRKGPGVRDIAQAYAESLADTTGRHKGCESCAVTLS